MEEQSFVVPRTVPTGASSAPTAGIVNRHESGAPKALKAGGLLTLGAALCAASVAKGRRAKVGGHRGTGVQRQVVKKVVEVPDVTDVEKGLGLTNFNPELWLLSV